MKNHKRVLQKIFCFVLAWGLLCLPCRADQGKEDKIAAEYVSEGMYDNFEQGNVIETVASADAISISATAAVLMERASGKVLYEKHPDEKRAPASITKVMTLLLTMEAIETGKLALTDRVTGSAHARSMGGSQIWLEDGEVMTVDELLKAVCVASANDAAVALAEHIAGSEEGFVAMMNKRAEQLGMENTHFVNCCGLDTENHYTTARDIAIMSRELLAHSLITEYSTIWMDSLRDGKTQLVNTNKLVRFYQGATGLKTGTTDDAGYCVSATAQRDGMELIAVILNGATSDQRFSDAKQLLNYGFANWATVQVHPEEIVLDDVTVCHGVETTVGVLYEEVGPFLVEKGKQDQVTAKVTLAESVEAPVAAGQVVGKISYLLDNEVIGEARLLTEKEVEKLTFSRGFWQLLRVMLAV